jgi:hypothetical protein
VTWSSSGPLSLLILMASSSTGCGDQPPGGSGVISPEYPKSEPETGAAQSLAGQLLPGHGAAVLLLL